MIWLHQTQVSLVPCWTHPKLSIDQNSHTTIIPIRISLQQEVYYNQSMQDNQDELFTNSIYGFLSRSYSDHRDDISQSLSEAYCSAKSKVKQIKTNLLYNIKHADLSILPLIQRKQIQIRNDHSLLQLLGQEYTHDNAHQFLYDFRNIFWLTYRKGIKEIESDNGWGCMIRTVQMLFAEVLKRNLQLTHNEKDQYEIIRYFSEQSDGIFSLSAICREGDIHERWTSSIENLGIFKTIIQKNPEYFKFNVEILSSGVIYTTPKSKLFDKYPVLLCLSSRVSLHDIPETHRPHYFSLMQHQSWVGAIGGIKGQALYIVGSYDEKVIVLDPHYVQSTEEELEVETYFCKTPRGISISWLSPSISFCYYLPDEQTHLQWLEWISNSCKVYYPHLIFELLSEDTKQELEQEEQKSAGSGEFQILE